MQWTVTLLGPQGEFDRIKTDPDFDFSALLKQSDAIVAGRGTFEPMAAAGRTSMPGMKTVAVSKNLRSADHPEIEIMPEIEALTDLKAKPLSSRIASQRAKAAKLA